MDGKGHQPHHIHAVYGHDGSVPLDFDSATGQAPILVNAAQSVVGSEEARSKPVATRSDAGPDRYQ